MMQGQTNLKHEIFGRKWTNAIDGNCPNRLGSITKEPFMNYVTLQGEEGSNLKPYGSNTILKFVMQKTLRKGGSQKLLILALRKKRTLSIKLKKKKRRPDNNKI